MVDGKNTFVMVSVLMITYGHEKYICKAIDGVLSQKSNFVIELIIANDHSPDNTDEFIAKYLSQKKLPKNLTIKNTVHTVNKGMQPNFIWAMQQVSGKYIALCEGDDYWTDPLKLQKQVDFLEANPEYVLCFHPVKILKPDGFLVEDFLTKVPDNYESQEELARGVNYIHTPSSVFRNVIKSFPPEFALSPIGDYFLYMLVTSHGKIKMLSDNMAVYRFGVGVHSLLETSQKHRDWREMITLMISAIDDFQIKTILLRKLFPKVNVLNSIEIKKQSNFKKYLRLFIPPVILIMKNRIFNRKS
jgi:glycosyltransferase involved in cell wall biosynthesis